MKKIMYICFALCFISLSVFNFFDYSVNTTNMIENGKVTIEVEKPKTESSAEFTSKISNISNSLNKDIMYKTVENIDDKSYSIYYKTNVNDDFLNIETENNVKKVNKNECFSTSPISSSNSKQLYLSSLMGDIAIFNFSDISKYDFNHPAIFYVDQDSNEAFTSELQNLGYQTNSNLIDEFKDSLSVFTFCFIPLLLFGLSCLFYILSKSKTNIIKKLDGFTSLNIILHEFISNLKIFALIFAFIQILSLSIIGILYGKLWLYFLKYSSENIMIFVVSLLLMFFLSLFIVFTQRDIGYIKGAGKKNLVYVITWIGKLVLIIVAINILVPSISTCVDIYELNQANQKIISVTNKFVTLPLSAPDGGTNRNLDGNLFDFYNKTKDKYNGVIIDSSNYQKSTNTSSRQEMDPNSDDIIINENYLLLNPIKKPNGTFITPNDFDYNKMNIMVPESKQYRIKQMIDYNKSIFDRFSDESKDEYKDIFIVSLDRINTIVYKDNETINSFHPKVSSGTFGSINNPVIKLYNEKYFIPQIIINFFSNGEYFIHVDSDDAYKELLPIIKETGLENTILRTPKISDVFAEKINNNIRQLTISMIEITLNLTGLAFLILFSIKTYCENNRDKIATRKLNGYGFFGVYKGYLVGLLASFGITMGACLIMPNMNPFIGLGIYAAELIAFYFISRSYTRKSILRILKGG